MNNMFINSGMEEKNKPSVEKYLKQTREAGVVFADEVAASRHNKPPGSKPLPEEISREILEYLPIGNIKNADIATTSGYRQSLKREALRPQPQAVPAPLPPQGMQPVNPGSRGIKRTASDAGLDDARGGKTRRRRNKRNARKSRKSKKTKKTRHSKKR